MAAKSGPTIRLKKAKKVAAPKRQKLEVYWVRLGTPNAMGEPVQVQTESAARNKMRSVFLDQQEFCRRSNHEGLDLIEEALAEIGEVSITTVHKRVSRNIDPNYSHLTPTCEVWKGPPA